MIQEHSAILSTFIKLPFVIKTFVLSFLRGCFTQVLPYSSYVILMRMKYDKMRVTVTFKTVLYNYRYLINGFHFAPKLVNFKNYYTIIITTMYSKTCLKRPLSKRAKTGFQDQLSPNACQKYCRMLQGPSLSYHLSLRSLFCLFLSGCLWQVLLYFGQHKILRHIYGIRTQPRS